MGERYQGTEITGDRGNRGQRYQGQGTEVTGTEVTGDRGNRGQR
jgi:hypothetical protein